MASQYLKSLGGDVNSSSHYIHQSEVGFSRQNVDVNQKLERF